MLTFSLRLNKNAIHALEKRLISAQQRGCLQEVARISAVLALAKGKSISSVALVLRVSAESVRSWLKKYLLNGCDSLKSKKKPGRPAKLTKNQRRELMKMIDQGPEAHGYTSSCWRSPIIQDLIYNHYDVYFNANYISELLKSMGFSYQKAKFVADKQDHEKRQEWLNSTWPEILALGKESNAYILFGDEASFPQWGSLGYTWSRIGLQPVVTTCGTRKSFKVFGLIDYFSGKFFSKGHEGKLNGESYIDFLKQVLAKTKKPILLIQDGAPYHKSKAVKQFFKDHIDRITVYQLPTYSPDYNPIEKLWKKIKQEGIHLTYFPTFDSLKEKVNEMVNIFSQAKNEVLPLFGFYNELEVA